MHPNIKLAIMARTHSTEQSQYSEYSRLYAIEKTLRTKLIEKWAIVQPLVYAAHPAHIKNTLEYERDGAFAIDFQDVCGQWGICMTTTYWFCDFLVAGLLHTR
jgi:hypothetical protein